MQAMSSHLSESPRLLSGWQVRGDAGATGRLRASPAGRHGDGHQRAPAAGRDDRRQQREALGEGGVARRGLKGGHGGLREAGVGAGEGAAGHRDGRRLGGDPGPRGHRAAGGGDGAVGRLVGHLPLLRGLAPRPLESIASHTLEAVFHIAGGDEA